MARTGRKPCEGGRNGGAKEETVQTRVGMVSAFHPVTMVVNCGERVGRQAAGKQGPGSRLPGLSDSYS